MGQHILYILKVDYQQQVITINVNWTILKNVYIVNHQLKIITGELKVSRNKEQSSSGYSEMDWKSTT